MLAPLNEYYTDEEYEYAVRQMSVSYTHLLDRQIHIPSNTT